MRTHKIRASLFFRSINANICTPKMTNEVAKAVRKATRLMPWVACPCPKVAVVVVAPDELVVEAVAVVEDILRSSLGVWNYRDMEQVSTSAFNVSCEKGCTVDRVKAGINIDGLGDLQSKRGMSEGIDRLYRPFILFTAWPSYGRLQETGYQPLRGRRRLICWMNWMKYWQGSDSKRKVMSGGR